MSDTASPSLLRARGLRNEYGKEAGLVRAVDQVDLDIARGETLAVMGPSGCGKSTLLHLLGGLDRPSGGELWLDGHRIDQLGEKKLARLRRDSIGFVFQAFHLMDELTAVENAELPALLAGRAPRAARRQALGMLEQVGLADRAKFLPSALSGGQRQRVAIARALANEPLVVLADEPTGNLDSEATLDVLRLFESLHTSGQTLVIVTHDPRIAATADRLISMRDGAFVDATTLTLAVVNVIFITRATALDNRHTSAVTRALGATPQQITAGLSAAQTLPALAGAILGIAGGLGLFAAANQGGGSVTPPVWWLIVVVLGTVLAVAGLTAIPARIDARRPAAEILQAETA